MDFSEYRIDTQDFMNNFYETLKKEMDDIPSAYIAQMTLLADQLDIYYEAKDEIKKNGIIVKDSRGGRVKSPATAIYNAASLNVSKLLNQFALTRMSKSKLKENKEELSAAEVLAKLTE